MNCFSVFHGARQLRVFSYYTVAQQEDALRRAISFAKSQEPLACTVEQFHNTATLGVLVYQHRQNVTT